MFEQEPLGARAECKCAESVLGADDDAGNTCVCGIAYCL
jgi:hypothetical protein